MNSKPLRNTTAHWRQIDTAHHLHPFTDTKDVAQAGGSRVITSAKGVTLTDSEGNKLIDGMAGLWCVNVGYGREELAKAAYDQMLELPYYNTFFKTTMPSVAELSQRLAELTPEGLNHVFYGLSGSDANDTIVRTIRHFWNLEGKPTKKTIISREYAYHGSTMVATSLCGMTAMHGQGDLPLPGFEHIMPPYWYDYGGDLSPDDFGLKAAQALEDKILELGPDNVAAFFGEPIQGAGAVIIPPKTYWPEIQKICRKYDVLLVADEVISGFGRTGHWFASEAFDIKPDFMTLAKGITSGYVPLSAVMVGDRVAKALIDKGGEYLHGYTYSGHPVSCAVALKNLEIIERDRPLPGRVPSRDRRAQIGRRGPLHGPGRRRRTGQGQGRAQAFRQARQDRHDVPRPLFRQRRHHASCARCHGHFAAADHHQERNRKTNGDTAQFARPDSEGPGHGVSRPSGAL